MAMESELTNYKNYKASIMYSEEDELFVGEVIGVSDSLYFHGRSVEELEESFHNCIDNYMEFKRKN